MPQNFIACDRAQSMLMPVDLSDWAPDDHVVWSILGAVDQMDLSAFYGAYRENGQRRAAYEPSVMALLLYSYARGNRSSRGIEREMPGGRCLQADHGDGDPGSLDDRGVPPPAREGLRAYVIPTLGSAKLTQLHRRDVQDFVDDFRQQGLSPSTITNILDPLRAIFRRAIRRDEVSIDPTDNLDLPAIRGRRDRIESPERAHEYLAALPHSEKAFLAVALFCGLRRGELRGLQWINVDFEGDVIRASSRSHHTRRATAPSPTSSPPASTGTDLDLGRPRRRPPDVEPLRASRPRR